MSYAKISAVVDRLVGKMNNSQTPVPGFIMGLSGTDSMVAFHMCYEALGQLGIEGRILGVHYVNAKRRKPTWFESEIIPWMNDRYPSATIVTAEPLGGNRDQQRWADLHLRALHAMDPIEPLPPGKNYWTVGTINASEMYLGKYSMLANSTSVQPLRNLWKSDIMAACKEIGVPAIALEMARFPDCFCGRDELAARNIELIDDIIRHRVDPTQHKSKLLKRLIEYVRTNKAENDFKMRTPFVP